MSNDPGKAAAGPGPSVPSAASPRTYLHLARNRGFRNLAVSTLISTIGDWMGFLAIIAMTASILGQTRAAAFAVSAVMAARVLPNLLLGPVAGVLVDRWNRKRVMIAAHLGRGLVMAMIPFTNEILTLLLATIVIELMSAMFGPARDAVFPTLVRRHQLVIANQLNLFTTYGTLPISGGLYALLVSIGPSLLSQSSFLAERPEAIPIWVNAISYLLAAAVVSRIPVTPRAASVSQGGPQQMGPWEQFKEGIRFVGGHPVIRSLILGVMVAAAVAGVVITIGEFFARLINAGPSGYGILVAVVGIGLVIGLGISAPLAARMPPERLFGPGIGIGGLGLVVTAVMPSLGWSIAPAMVMGAGTGIAFIVGYTVLQRRSEDRIRGRTFGAFNAGVRASIFGSTIFAPVLIGVLGREQRVLTEQVDGTLALTYPYTFGGVRIALLLGGALALFGAVATGRSLSRALAKVDEAGFDLASTTAEAHTPVAGFFVVFEGGDGAGKSTQIRLLRAAIERAGMDAVVTREPGGTPIGEKIREVLLSSDSSGMTDQTEALLYAAARAQHVQDVIAPALATGAVVVCDRYVDSSIIYQGVGRGLGETEIAELNRWATDGLSADLTILLDVEPQEGLRRATEGRSADRLESEGIDFHEFVADAYRRLADSDPDRYLVLDATLPVEQLHETIRESVLRRLEVPKMPRGPSSPVDPTDLRDSADAADREAQ